MAPPPEGPASLRGPCTGPPTRGMAADRLGLRTGPAISDTSRVRCQAAPGSVRAMATRIRLSARARRRELAVPRTFDARYGDGIDRGLCLGGGGLFFVAWQAAYLRTLASHGIRFDTSDRVVGTSAGSMVASALAAGKLNRLHSEISVVSKVPAIVSALAPASQLRPQPATGARPVPQGHRRRPGHRPGDRARRPGRPDAQAAATPRRNVLLVLGTVRWTIRRTADHLCRRLHRRAVRGDPRRPTRPYRGRCGQQRRAGDLRRPTHRRPPVHGRRGERHRNPSRPARRGQAGADPGPDRWQPT